MARVTVIGGGPAGMLAASSAALAGNKVQLIEKNEKLGKKLYLTGKGRCNITNVSEGEQFFGNVARNPKFLYSALYEFGSNDIIRIIESQGVKVKTERGGRVFPSSDKSSDVLRALTQYVRSCGVEIRLNTNVQSIEKSCPEGFTVYTDTGKISSDALILATGGVSYPKTGSTGDGYRFAAQFGHTIKQPKPSLVPLVTEEQWPKLLQGLTLKNVKLKAVSNNKRVYEEQGEMMFTHFGVTGPLILSASSYIADSPENTILQIDLKPALDTKILDARVLRDFSKHGRKQISNALVDLLPSRLIPVIIKLSGLNPDKTADQISRQERFELVKLLKALPLTVKSVRSIDEAIVTRGGVCVNEISSSTMESKLQKGLFFAGEIIDVDGLTGGYNLQIAFSTGVLAGRSVR
ncbi:MAG: tricarballylate dehydrogenase [Firmicutes bacterium ADurb.Bin182]|nr:MAG: tricarballylate dehydrogenase [Firmicutes bacterium ADurb.Bin182]